MTNFLPEKKKNTFGINSPSFTCWEKFIKGYRNTDLIMCKYKVCFLFETSLRPLKNSQQHLHISGSTSEGKYNYSRGKRLDCPSFQNGYCAHGHKQAVPAASITDNASSQLVTK